MIWRWSLNNAAFQIAKTTALVEVDAKSIRSDAYAIGIGCQIYTYGTNVEEPRIVVSTDSACSSGMSMGGEEDPFFGVWMALLILGMPVYGYVMLNVTLIPYGDGPLI